MLPEQPTRSAFIYVLYDAEFVPRYVGKSVHPRVRFRGHKQNKDWLMTYLILEEVKLPERWQDRERFWIAYYRQWYKLDNIRRGGGGTGLVNLTLEHRAKISLGLIGRSVSTETRAKIGAANRIAQTGKKRSPEHIAASAAGHRGIPCSDEKKQRIREALIGRKRPPEVVAKMSAAMTGKKRKPHSEEARRKMSVAAKLRENRKRELRSEVI